MRTRRPSPRQIEIIGLLADGKCNKQIARDLGLTIRGVRAHIERAMLITNTNKAAGLVGLAFREGWIE